MGTTERPIPRFYRVFFTTLDPIVALSGVVANLFFPSLILTSYSATPTLPPSAETTALLHGSAGYLLSTMFLQIVLLRLCSDITVWRCLQTSILIQDVVLLASAFMAVADQGRGLSTLRGEEVGNLIVLIAVGGLRAAFLMRLGFSEDECVGEYHNKTRKRL
ncbi:hypothetical protein PV08_01843 [Exophiala spinifera]|uniref:DUF7704 domain-containing protein n=1 Tax=Exophiala spinifera TaxID=91928 RepID=A0A0D2BQJ9_9EURO|nr:uncharacterized protein PV08_01843 [Exophiala spinifera]KIW21263.1 hypothetical protein PV08_01843 [Exophiala spinifera]